MDWGEPRQTGVVTAEDRQRLRGRLVQAGMSAEAAGLVAGQGEAEMTVAEWEQRLRSWARELGRGG